MKGRVEGFYHRMVAHQRDLGLRLPSRTIDLSHVGGQMYFTADQAFDIYAAQVAHSHLSAIHQLSHDAALCSGPLVQLAVRSHGLRGQLPSNIKTWKGGYTDEEIPTLKSLDEYRERMDACLAAVGGAEQLDGLLEKARREHGRNVMVQR